MMSLGCEDASSLLLFYENSYLWNTDSPAKILQTLTFILHNFLWLDIISRIKIVKINNIVMLVPLSIWRTGPYSVGFNSDRFQKYNRKLNILS